MKLPSYLLCCLSLCIAGSASAHDTWLLARTPDAAAAGTLTLDLTSGMGFPVLDHAVTPDRVDVARFRLGSRLDDVRLDKRAEHSLTFKVASVSSGIGVAWVTLNPKSLELDPAKIDEYMDEIGATPALRESAKQRGKARWRETYTKHAKAMVVVGEAGKDSSWSKPVGMTLEIVPDTNPATLRAGSSFDAHVLRNGKPFANFVVGIVGEGNTSIAFRTTDAQGRASFPVPSAGKWLLRGTDLRASSRADMEWESDFTTLTFEAR